MLTIKVTTLSNSTTEMKDVEPSTSVGAFKARYEKETGTPAPQQRLWFPVPEGTPNAQPASSFPWWEKAVTNGTKPKELLDAMGAQPLLLSEDAQTIGGLARRQVAGDIEGGAGPAVQCYLILNLKGGTL